ncbi:MAG: YeeE/YedE family protein [Anaerolineae bacterium]|nr:YeeE/YedE family protein [Anaerolineae bacterium]
MTKRANSSRRLELLWGLVFGLLFGLFLQKSGVTHYDVIVGQLLLEDFTVLKVMLSAVVAGMVGIYAMKQLGWVTLSIKGGSLGINVIGGLLFGVGFAVLGYCPGTLAGAIGNGALDALVGGTVGILLGAGLYAELYPRLRNGILRKGEFGSVTLPELLKVNAWWVVIPACAILILAMVWIEAAGL